MVNSVSILVALKKLFLKGAFRTTDGIIRLFVFFIYGNCRLKQRKNDALRIHVDVQPF